MRNVFAVVNGPPNSQVRDTSRKRPCYGEIGGRNGIQFDCTEQSPQPSHTASCYGSTLFRPCGQDEEIGA